MAENSTPEKRRLDETVDAEVETEQVVKKAKASGITA